MLRIPVEETGANDGLVVLHIEDNPGDARLVQLALAGSGRTYCLKSAETLDEGLHVLEQGGIDVVLLDLGLPGVEGAGAIHGVNSLAPETPIVVLTGDADPGRVAEAFAAYADDFLPKSDISSVTLCRALEHSVERRRLAVQVRKQGEQIASSEARLRMILEAIIDGILVVDDLGHVLYANPAAEALYGSAPERGATWCVGALGSEPGAVMKIERIGTDDSLADDRVRTVELHSHSIDWQGRPARFISLRDVTDRERLQTQVYAARRMEQIGQLAGGMAHEVNNLLQVVLGDAALLQGQLQHDEDSRVLAIEIERVALRGGTLMRELLAYGRRTRLDLQPRDLAATVSALRDTLGRLLPPTVELTVEVPDESQAVVADQDAVERILINLVNNARDAISGAGHLTIRVDRAKLGAAFCRDHPGARPGDFVRLAVSDDGSGMSAETLERVFEPFFSTKPAGVGTGLGMPTVYGLVKQHDGYLDVESEVGVGSIVSAYFPVLERAVELVSATPVSKTVKGGTETILFVEDEDAVRRAGERVLRRLGYRVVAAPNGQVALGILDAREPPIDLVLSDVVMPIMGGQELADELADRDGSPPILFTSGYPAADLRGGKLLDPELPLVEKPWSIEELSSELRRVLSA